MLERLLIGILIGRLLIFLAQRQPRAVQVLKFIGGHLVGRTRKDGEEFASCVLCLGVWAYFGIACLFQIDILKEIITVGFPIVNYFLTGCVISFLMWLLETGWKAHFSVTYLGKG